jgi:uncharacterized membrane protein (DUF2068 family)
MTQGQPIRAERPLGVTIIAVLAAIGGVFGVIGSIALFSLLGSAPGIFAAYALMNLAISVLLLVFAFGAWTLQPWAWTLGVVLEAVAIVLGLYALVDGDASAVVSIALAAVVLWYLFQPSVKAAFGRT